MRRTLSLLLAAIVVTGLCTAVWAGQAAVLMEKAVYTEETAGDVSAAIELYKQVITDPEVPRLTAAQAHHRLAQCYLKTGQRDLAAGELRTLIQRYDDQQELVDAASALLDGLSDWDPAELMPADTVVYFEVGSPGRQIETVLNMLEGTPFADPLAMVAEGMPEGAGPGPQQVIGALLNPGMLEDVKKVRGWAVGFNGFHSDVSTNFPEGVVVLFPGESNMLKMAINMGVAFAGPRAEPIEGMNVVHVNMPGGGGIAYDDDVVIFANPIETLEWCARQYKGVGDGQTLAATNTAFARVDKRSRQNSAFTSWVDSGGLFTLIETVGGEDLPMEFHQVRGMVEMNGVEGLVSRFVLDEENPFTETTIHLKEGVESPFYGMLRTPPLDKSVFQTVPSEAVAVLASTVSPGQFAMLRMSPEAGASLPTEPAQVAVFLLPLDPGRLAGNPAEAMLSRLGIAISTGDAGQSAALMESLAAIGDTMALDFGLESPPVQEEDGTMVLPLPTGGPLQQVYVAGVGSVVVVAADPAVVDACRQAVEGGESALSAGPLHEPLARLAPEVSKVLLGNVGHVMAIVNALNESAGQMPEGLLPQLNDLAVVLEGTSFQACTVETDSALTLRHGMLDLPPLADALPLIMALTQYGSTGGRTATAAVRYRTDPVTVDGDTAEWSDVAPLPWSYGSAGAGAVRLAWTEEGLYGAATFVDDRIEVNDVDAWAADGLQLFIETDNARRPGLSEMSRDLTFWPTPVQGPGGANIRISAVGTERDSNGADPESGIECSWVQTADGYSMEFFLPAAFLDQPAQGSEIGLCVFLRTGGPTPTASFCARQGDNTWQRPGDWGTVRLVGQETPVDVAYRRQPVNVDGNLDDWQTVARVPWTHGDPRAGTFQLCWREEGLYGAVQSADAFIEVNDAEPWTNDGAQMLVETDAARSPRPTASVQHFTFWPTPAAGPGGANISLWNPGTNVSAGGVGEDETTGTLCQWGSSEEGYAMEFFVPAAVLAPADMAEGTRLGMLVLLRNGGISPIASFCSEDRDDSWNRPDVWAVVRLTGPQ